MQGFLVRQIFGFAALVAWLLYFHYSRRVHETFGQNL